jgi:hypothetical protein
MYDSTFMPVAASMRRTPAAQLDRVGDAQHAHDVAVLLFEDADRAALLGLGHRQHVGRDLGVP